MSSNVTKRFYSRDHQSSTHHAFGFTQDVRLQPPGHVAFEWSIGVKGQKLYSDRHTKSQSIQQNNLKINPFGRLANTIVTSQFLLIGEAPTVHCSQERQDCTTCHSLSNRINQTRRGSVPKRSPKTRVLKSSPDTS